MTQLSQSDVKKLRTVLVNAKKALDTADNIVADLASRCRTAEANARRAQDAYNKASDELARAGRCFAWNDEVTIETFEGLK